jgi:hypothetical protein
MSDKEFDKQFRGKFEDFEITPSPMVWETINKNLPGTKKKPFPSFQLAAASVATLVAVGLWLTPGKEPLKLYGKAKIEETTVPAKIERHSYSEALRVSEIEIEEPIRKEPTLARARLSQKAKVWKDEQPQGRVSADENKPVPVPDAPLLTERVDTNEKLQDRSLSVTYSSKKAQQEILALHEETDSTADKSRHRIKSFGDLVNFVVARVDKRRNKIIEFSKDDEGEEISGLNLGVLQYKTRAN